jgi:3',5'-cyclic-AMP phosphodiesterase
MFSLRRLLLSLLLVTSLSQAAFAGTLYQHSLRLLNQRGAMAAASDFTFVVLGDSRDGDAVFAKGLQLARSFSPLFILHGGDYSRGGGEAETAHFLKLVKENIPEIPLFVVMGNHENREVFTREIGPLHFTLRSKRLGLALVAVDNSDDILTAPELEYLRSQLSASGKNRFVAMHVPPRTERWSWHSFTEGEEELKRILAKERVQGAFFSHVHLFDSATYGGVPAFITGGAGAPLVTMGFPGDPVNHILVVRVKNGKASFRKVPIPGR